MDYEIKIKNHKKLNFDDIKAFCLVEAKKYELDDYVIDITLKKILFGIATYNKEEHTICVNKGFLKEYRRYKKKIKTKSSIGLNKLFEADFFNLFIINTIFHELYHAKQEKMKTDFPDSSYSKLIKISHFLKSTSGTAYLYFHDHFFHEYDAIINSFLATINYIQKFSIDKRTLFLFNKSFSMEILNAYGMDLETKSSSKYLSPIEFFKVLLDKKCRLDTETKKQVFAELENSINAYQPSGEIDALLCGYPIPENFLERLVAISFENVTTINVLADLKSISKDNSK